MDFSIANLLFRYANSVRIPLASSGLRQEDIDNAIDVLRSGFLTMGSKVKAFEEAMANYLRCSHFVMVNSGSSANLVIFEALLRPAKGAPTLRPGDGVLVPAIAWPTTVWPIIQLGLRPVFVDVNEENLGIDLLKAEIAIKESKFPVKALFPIHPLGRALDPHTLTNFANKHDLVLVNDVCESLGSWVGSTHAGLTGVAGSFSFYFSHHITTMEGGGVATNDSNFADDLRSIRSHGWSRDRTDVNEWTEGVTNNDSKFLFISAGYNVRPMEIQAAIGLSQIRDVDKFISQRRRIAERVNESLAGSDFRLIGATTLNGNQVRSNSWMLLPIQATGTAAYVRKLQLAEKLGAADVETRPVLTGNFLEQPAMKRIYKDSPDPSLFSSANHVARSTLLVGAHQDLTESQLTYLCETIRSSTKA
jgi:CDP-6-deoxy-D-xylo-4-hexulose-3-dehydrase